MIVLIDGYNLAYRCFHAISGLSRADGFPTNAIHGWIKSVWKIQDLYKPTRVVAFFDLGLPADRLKIHPDYKGQRDEMPAELRSQIPHLKELSQLLGIPIVEQAEVEADDLMASYAVQQAAQDEDVLLFSSDKDLAQIVSDRIKLLSPPPTANPKIGWRVIDREGVVAKFGVGPEQIIDYLSLLGDSADNIPGVPGVGPKTACKWLNEFGNIDEILANADKVKPDRFRTLLAEQGPVCARNRQLIRLNTDLIVTPQGHFSPDLSGLVQFLDSMEMNRSSEEARRRYEQISLF